MFYTLSFTQAYFSRITLFNYSTPIESQSLPYNEPYCKRSDRSLKRRNTVLSSVIMVERWSRILTAKVLKSPIIPPRRQQQHDWKNVEQDYSHPFHAKASFIHFLRGASIQEPSHAFLQLKPADRGSS